MAPTPTTRDIETLLNEIRENGYFAKVMGNPMAQFGEPNKGPLIGATLMPEQLVEDNSYYETAISYRTEIANDGTRYSPVQMKGSALVGTMSVQLVDSDVGADFTAREYEALTKALMRGGEIEAIASLVNWANSQLMMPLVHKSEKYIWDAIVDAQIVRSGDGGFTETVTYSDPANHRYTLTSSGTVGNPAGWFETDATDTYDPWDDIYDRVDLLAGKGYTVSRIVTSRYLFNKLASHHKARQRLGPNVINYAGQMVGTGQVMQASLNAVNALLGQDDLPPIEIYDRRYYTSTGSARFLDQNKMVFLAATGRDQTLDLGDDENLITRNGGSPYLSMPNTLGYVAIGKCAGASTPGRQEYTEVKQRKPKTIYGEAYQCTIPVIMEPEAIAVLTVPDPTP